MTRSIQSTLGKSERYHDAHQDAWLRAIEQGLPVPSRNNKRTMAFNAMRKEQRERRELRKLGELGSFATRILSGYRTQSPLTILIHKEAVNRIQAQLPEELVEHFDCGYTICDTAAQLRVAQPTLSDRIKRIRENLKTSR